MWPRHLIILPFSVLLHICKSEPSHPYEYWKPPVARNQYHVDSQEFIAEERRLHSPDHFNSVYSQPGYGHENSYLDYGDYSDGPTLEDKEISNQVSQGLRNWQHHYSGSNIQRQDRIFFGVPPLQAAGLLLAVAAFGGLGAQLGVGDIISDIIDPTTTTTTTTVASVAATDACASVTCTNGLTCTDGTCVCGKTGAGCSTTMPLCALNSIQETVCQCDTTSCPSGHTCCGGVCKCGDNSECSGTSNICQTANGASTCVCGTTGAACTDTAIPSCLTTADKFLALDSGSTCKACSKEVGSVTSGDATTQGTCPLASDVCLSDGKCMCQLDLLGGGMGNGMAKGTCTNDCDRCKADGTCKCQKELGVAGDGDGTTKGTCTDDSHKCLDDGSCSVCRISDSSGCASNSNICTNGECKCGLTDAVCDSSPTSTTPLCITTGLTFVRGDVSATCQGCTKYTGVAGAGDGTTQGSCTTSSHKCFDDGSCKECAANSDCSGNANSCDVATGICKCASNDKCDASSATPSCLNPDTNVYEEGGATSVCGACNKGTGTAADGDGTDQGTCPLTTDKCLATGKCGCLADADCTAELGANKCTDGTCKCGATDACDVSSSTPSCLKPDDKMYAEGDDTAVCSACTKGDQMEGDGTDQGSCAVATDFCHSSGSCSVCDNSILRFDTGSFHSGCEAATPICDKTVYPPECKACVADALPNALSCGSTAGGAVALGLAGGGEDLDGSTGSCSTGANMGCECDAATNTGCPAGQTCTADADPANLNACA